MPRSAAEINAEAQRLRDEAQALVATAQARLGVAQQTINNAGAAAQAARASAGDAVTATAAGNLVAAEGHCTAAKAHLAAAVTIATQTFASLAGGDPKDEWQECRQSIDRFDKLLVDLRKTGFGFITTIVGASALFIGTATKVPSAELQFGVFVIIGLLIIMLFGVDCTHQVWLKTAVRRAIQLETNLNYAITNEISSRFSGREAWIIGIVLYMILFATTSLIFWVALDVSGQQGSADYQWRTIYSLITGVPLILVIGIFTYRR